MNIDINNPLMFELFTTKNNLYSYLYMYAIQKLSSTVIHMHRSRHG